MQMNFSAPLNSTGPSHFDNRSMNQTIVGKDNSVANSYFAVRPERDRVALLGTTRIERSLEDQDELLSSRYGQSGGNGHRRSRRGRNCRIWSSRLSPSKLGKAWRKDQNEDTNRFSPSSFHFPALRRCKGFQQGCLVKFRLFSRHLRGLSRSGGALEEDRSSL